MKVRDLLTEGMKGYKPRYDADQKVMYGAVSDWLEKMGVSKADVTAAVAKIKADEIIKQLADAGMELVDKPASEKRGTLTFKVKRTYPAQEFSKVDQKWVKVADRLNSYDTVYQVYANGQIRHGNGQNFYQPSSPADKGTVTGQTRLQSPKPRLKAGDPVESLLMIYRASLKEVLNKWEKAKKKMAQSIEKARAEGRKLETGNEKQYSRQGPALARK